MQTLVYQRMEGLQVARLQFYFYSLALGDWTCSVLAFRTASAKYVALAAGHIVFSTHHHEVSGHSPVTPEVGAYIVEYLPRLPIWDAPRIQVGALPADA